MTAGPESCPRSQSREMKCRNFWRAQVKGQVSPIHSRMGTAAMALNRSGWALAMIFGEISPKVMMSTVMMAVATQAPFSPMSPTAMTVARDEAPMFTRLFPTRMEMSAFSNRFFTLRARG